MRHDLTEFAHLITDSTSLDLIQTSTVSRVRGSLTFADQSQLFIRENYVIGDGWIDYSYHWQTAENQLIHRWDNAHVVPLPTSPHHQHIGNEENIQSSGPMTLETVLTFIAGQISTG